MFQEPTNTPFCLNWLVLAFLTPAIKNSYWYKQLSLCKVGCTGSFWTPGAFLTLLLCADTRVGAGILRSRASELALSYSITKHITTCLSSEPASPSAFPAHIDESVSSLKPQPKPLNLPPPQCLTPPLPLNMYTFKRILRLQGGTGFDPPPCSCLKDNLVNIKT